jgi:hypothetical protein
MKSGFDRSLKMVYLSTSAEYLRVPQGQVLLFAILSSAGINDLTLPYFLLEVFNLL